MTSYISIRRIMQSWYFLPLFLLVLVFGCQDKEIESLFDKTTSERSQEQINELRKLLKLSEFGWTLDYRPDAKETNTYSFVFKFPKDKDNIVVMSSDFSVEDAEPRESEYDVFQGSTTKLSFTTRGSIHQLSDSGDSPIPNEGGSGLKGDFEFLYYGGNEDTIFFKTNRTQDTLIFRKATAESQGKVKATSASLGVLNSFLASDGFLSLEYSKGGVPVKSSFVFNTSLRQATIKRLKENSTEFDEEYKSWITIEQDAIRMDSIQVGADKVLKDVVFRYDESGNQFVATPENGATVLLRFDPIPIVSEHKLVLNGTSFLWFFYLDGDVGSLTTAPFNALYAPFAVDFGGQFRLYPKPKSTVAGENGYLATKSGMGGFLVEELLTFEDAGDRLVMSSIIVNGGLSLRKNEFLTGANAAQYFAFTGLLLDAEGFYVVNLGPVTQFSNHIYILISARDPSVQIAFYHVGP